jgi:hypothetical protein
MSLYKLPPSAIIHSFSESYAVMVNHLPSCICLMWQLSCTRAAAAAAATRREHNQHVRQQRVAEPSAAYDHGVSCAAVVWVHTDDRCPC